MKRENILFSFSSLHRRFFVTFFISSGNCYQLHKISEKCVGFKRQKICEFCQKNLTAVCAMIIDWWLDQRGFIFSGDDGVPGGGGQLKGS